MARSKAQIHEFLRRAINRRVGFNYPGGKGNKRGTLKDRAIVSSGVRSSGAHYWDVVDLIEFPHERHKRWIRVGYYRQVGDRILWASQTTITEPLHKMRRLLIEAAVQKPWFAKLLWQAATISRERITRQRPRV
jgi:hypothetical protein